MARWPAGSSRTQLSRAARPARPSTAGSGQSGQLVLVQRSAPERAPPSGIGGGRDDDLANVGFRYVLLPDGWPAAVGPFQRCLQKVLGLGPIA